MKLTPAMKKRIKRLSKDEFRVVEFLNAHAALRDLLASGIIIAGKEIENCYGIMRPSYKLA